LDNRPFPNLIEAGTDSRTRTVVVAHDERRVSKEWLYHGFIIIEQDDLSLVRVCLAKLDVVAPVVREFISVN